jgi:hypothetical protein
MPPRFKTCSGALTQTTTFLLLARATFNSGRIDRDIDPLCYPACPASEGQDTNSQRKRILQNQTAAQPPIAYTLGTSTEHRAGLGCGLVTIQPTRQNSPLSSKKRLSKGN